MNTYGAVKLQDNIFGTLKGLLRQQQRYSEAAFVVCPLSRGLYFKIILFIILNNADRHNVRFLGTREQLFIFTILHFLGVWVYQSLKNTSFTIQIYGGKISNFTHSRDAILKSNRDFRAALKKNILCRSALAHMLRTIPQTRNETMKPTNRPQLGWNMHNIAVRVFIPSRVDVIGFTFSTTETPARILSCLLAFVMVETVARVVIAA